MLLSEGEPLALTTDSQLTVVPLIMTPLVMFLLLFETKVKKQLLPL